MGYVRLQELFFRDPVPISALKKRPGWKEAESIVHHETDLSGTYESQTLTINLRNQEANLFVTYFSYPGNLGSNSML